MSNAIGGFRDFVLRGNVVDLAAAVVIGAAFNAIVDGLLKGVIEPAIALAAPTGNIAEAYVVGPFHFGVVLAAIINFVLKAAVVYFFIVRPFAGYAARFAPKAAAAAPSREEVLLGEIRDLLARPR